MQAPPPIMIDKIRKYRCIVEKKAKRLAAILKTHFR